MHYHSLSVKGFGPHSSDARYTFSDGTIIITGKNGSGKTTIMDAVSWGMHGPRAALRTIKDRTSVINSDSQSAQVTLSVIDGESTMHIVRGLTRSGKHSLKVTVDGEEVEGGLNVSQQVIDDFCGNVSSDMFTHVSTYSSAPSMVVNPFISENDRDRRKFLADLVDPDGDYELTNKVVKDRLRDEKKTLTKMEGRREGLLESAPEEPNLRRLKEVAEEITIFEGERRRLEQRMTASRSRDDIQVSGLIDTHQSEAESLSSRITELTTRREEIVADVDESNELIDELEENLSLLNEKLSSYRVRSVALDNEIDAAKERISHHQKMVGIATDRIATVDSELFAVKHLVELSESLDDECALCGSPLTETSHRHLEEMSVQSNELSAARVMSENILSTSRGIITSVNDYLDVLLDKRDAVDPERVSLKLDTAIADIERISRDQESQMKMVDELDSDIADLRLRVEHHKSMVESLTKEVDPEVLKEQSELNNTWDYIVDQLSEYNSEYHRIKDQEKAWEKFQDKITSIDTEINRLRKVVAQLTILRDQTSPTGDISIKIARMSQSISEIATTYLDEVFDRQVPVEIVTGTEDGDATCRITVDGRDISTHSHGEQVRFIAVILTALAEVSEKVTGCWLPLLWDEPTMATDIGMTVEIMDMLSDNESRQVMILTRDKFPEESATQIISL